MKRYTITYFFNHSRMGFSNQITVEATNEEQAREKARAEVSQTYGSKMLKRFTFK